MVWTITFVFTTLLVASLIFWLIYLLGETIKKQARKEERFFTVIPTPATFVFKMLEGRVQDVIENVISWKLDDMKRFVIDKANSPKTPGIWFQRFLIEKLGALWLGIYDTIYVAKDWQWTEFRQITVKEGDRKIPKYEIESRKESFSEFRFQFSYGVPIENIELEGNIQATVKAVFTVLYLYPIRAVFLNKNLPDLFAAMVRSSFRAWMNNMKFEKIKQITLSGDKSAAQLEEKEFWSLIDGLNGLTFKKDGPDKGNPDYENATNEGIYGKLGIAVIRVELEQIEAEDEAGKALQAKKLAQLQGEANIEAANKKAEVTIIEADARLQAAERDALAQRTLNEQNAGYYASLPGGARMFVADKVASKDSDLTTWVEARADIDVNLPLPPAPPKPEKKKRVENQQS